MDIKIEVSARHCHISQKHLEKLFGRGYKLRKLKNLSQRGEFASKEMVILKTKAGELGLRILGPVREQTQIELSRSDAYNLKINPPVNLSGDLTESKGGILIGIKGKIRLEKGVIIAKRHLHCNPQIAKKLKLKNNQKVAVEIKGERAAILKNIIVRIKDTFTLAVHFDTDEANAVLPKGVCTMGKLLR